jgi:hypothetical protein
VVYAQIDHCLVASGNAASNGLEVGPPAAAPTDSQTYNGLWITDNFFQNYQGTPSGSGIIFDSGTYARRNVYVVDNQFYNEGYAASFDHPVVDSVIRGNFGVSMTGTGALLNLNASGAQSFSGTVISDNTTPDQVLAVYKQAGGGYQLGFNQSGSSPTAPYQLTGSQIGTATGCVISGGAIGSNCATPTTVTWPIPFADSSYLVQCSETAPAGNNPTAIGAVSITNGATISVNLTALSSASTGGGTVTCTGTHN